MSCRVLKRGVEQYLVNHLFDQCRRRGLAGVRGQYIASPKNAMVKDFYPGFGFDCVSQDDRRSEWYLPLANFAPKPTMIKEIE